jgi:hypothetical protein
MTAGGEEEQVQPQSEDVARRLRRLASQHFRCSILSRRRRQILRAAERAEVTNDRANSTSLPLEKDIGRFQISVRPSGCVHKLQSTENLFPDRRLLFNAELPKRFLQISLWHIF